MSIKPFDAVRLSKRVDIKRFEKLAADTIAAAASIERSAATIRRYLENE